MEPRKLTKRDKFELAFAALVTLVRVVSLLGAAFLLLAWSFAFDGSFLPWVGSGVALYVASTYVMHRLLHPSREPMRSGEHNADA